MSVAHRAKPVLRNNLFFPPERCVASCVYGIAMFPRPILDLDFTLHGQPLPAGMAFARVGIAKSFDHAGVLRDAASGVARVNSFVFDGSNWINHGLLIEEERTNRITRSEEFDHSDWTKAVCTITANAATAPDGTTTADKVIPNNTSSTFIEIYQDVSVVDTQPQTITYFVKEDVWRYVQIIGSGPVYGSFYVNFDTRDGTITANVQGDSASVAVASVENVGNGWFRIRVTKIAQATSAAGRLALNFIDGPTVVRGASITGNGVDGLFAWGVQHETNVSFPSSYIGPTLGAVVTRNADVVTIAISAFPGFSQSQGTILVEANIPVFGGAFDYLCQIDKGDGTDRIRLLNNSGTLSGYTINSVGDNGISTISTVTAGVSFNATLTFAQDYVVVGIDGAVDPTPDTSADLPTANALTIFRVGSNHEPLFFNGYIALVALWNLRAPNAISQRLTA